jgi:putative transposase
MMSSRLTVAALERAVTERQPPAGLVHHSDRGLQYASPEYVAALEKYGMVASMSRPGANPFDNASCESFMKTLKREEIYANRYRDLDDLHANVEEFIEQYYNRQRLHSALGYQSPVEFEQRNTGVAVESRSATMVFFENNVNEQRGSSELQGKGTQSPSPSPGPNPR